MMGQGMMGGGGMMRRDMSQGMMGPMAMMRGLEGRLAYVKAELANTDAQSAVGNAYADAVRPGRRHAAYARDDDADRAVRYGSVPYGCAYQGHGSYEGNTQSSQAGAGGALRGAYTGAEAESRPVARHGLHDVSYRYGTQHYCPSRSHADRVVDPLATYMSSELVCVRGA